jgi:hypothetical protein
MESKVTTFTSIISRKQQKVEKIIEALKLHPEGATPKLISSITGIKHSTVRGLISKIISVERLYHGIYHYSNCGGDGGVKFDLQKIENWNFHNLTLSCQTDYVGIEVKDNFTAGLNNYRFGISTVGNAYMYVSGEPLSLSCIDSVFQIFRLKCEKLGFDIKVNDVFVRQIEFNQDLINCNLEGVACITIRKVVEELKLYNKGKNLRIEHKMKVPIKLNTLFDLLMNTPNNTETNERITKLEAQQVINNQLLEKLLEKLDKKW